MFKYDKYITNNRILTKYINKTYQHKNKYENISPKTHSQMNRNQNTVNK